jgi:competence protein ComGC
MKTNANFIGNYHVTDTSALHFMVLVKESMVTAEIIDTLYPTFEGYNIETWILFTFFGNSPNSITIDFPPLHSNGKPQKPLILVDPDIPLPILDYNWNSNLNRLTLWLYSNISDEYKFGLKWILYGNNVSISEINIIDVSILNYHIIYYLEQGVIFNHITQSGLSRSGYDSIPLKLRTNLNSGSNLEVYSNDGTYNSKLSIEKSTDLKSEIFLRVWIDDLIFNLQQIIRVTSDYMITGIFTFLIPTNVTSITVSNCASWTIINNRMIIYPTGIATNYMTFIIDAKLTKEHNVIIPFKPQQVGETRIYTMFGSSTNLNPKITLTNAESMNPDELPKYFLNEIKTQKAVLMYYSQESPTFEIELEKFEMEEPPTTIIEFAQITIIRSLDGKIAVRATYMVKNSNRVVLHIRLPAGGIVWMVLVGGKTIPIIQKDELLTITLLRSTITGQNIAFPVEIVYLTTESTADLEFIIPKVDVEILNLKVNIGLPSSVFVDDPLQYNPNFELDGRDRWNNKNNDPTYPSDPYIDQADLMTRELNQVSYDKDVKEPDTIYIGFKDHNDYSDNIINIRRADDKTGATYSSYNINTMASFIDPISNNTFVKLNLDQGQYLCSNSGNERKVTVLGGNYQQVLFDSDDEVVFTDIPPIYLHLPESGQVIRLSAIFIKPNENISIRLVEGEPEDDSSRNDFQSFFSSPTSLMIIIIWILVIIIVLNLIKHRKEIQKTSKKSKQKTVKRKKRSIKDQRKSHANETKIKQKSTRSLGKNGIKEIQPSKDDKDKNSKL